MYQHFVSKGLMETANSLLREASLDSPVALKAVTSYQPFHYRSPAPAGVSNSSKTHIQRLRNFINLSEARESR